MRKFLSTICLLLFTALPAFANNLVLSNATLEDRNKTAHTVVVQFNISWDHSWRKNDGRHDAVWVFTKIYCAPGGVQGFVHGKMYTAGTNPTRTSPGTNSDLKIVVPSDKMGAFLERTASGNGTFESQKVQLNVDYGANSCGDMDQIYVKLYGIEMIYIPEGPFYVGESNNPYSAETPSGVQDTGNGEAFFSVFNSSGTYQWSKRLGGTNGDYGNSVMADTTNNVIVAGGLTGNADLNGNGTTSDTNEAGNTGVYGAQDIFVSVFNSAATFQWSKRLGGTGGDSGSSVTTDTANNVIMLGYVSGNADLNGNGTTSDTNETGNTGVYNGVDAFISVFNSAGTYQWSKRLGGTAGSDYGNGVTTDTANNVVVEGTVFRTADLNGDGDTADTNETGNTGVYGGQDIFISIFNSAGTFQWSKRLGGTDLDTGLSVTTNTSNDVIIEGYLGGTADLNGNGTTSDTNETGNTGVYGGNDIFIAVFNSAGSYQWSKRLGGTGGDSGNSVTTDMTNNIIIGGTVFRTADLNGDGDTADTNEIGNTGVYGGADVFIAVFNSAGTFQWSRRLGGTGSDFGNAVTTDTANNVIISGYINGNADLNGNGTTADTNETGNTGVYGGDDAFISVFNSAGTFQWSKRLGGTTSSDYGNGVTNDTSNNVIVAGSLTGNADLNSDAAIVSTYPLYSPGSLNSASQITTSGATISTYLNSNDDIDTSTTTVTGLAGITGNTSWPNGYSAFYAMKYEITQAQYVDFLNTLSRVQQGNRVAATVSGNTIANYYVMTNGTSVTARQGIRAPASGNGTSPTTVVFGNDLNGNGTFNETDDGQSVAMNYMSWMDLTAYADWAALRPMTELEYEKVVNGPNSPTYGYGAWASTTITTVTSVSNGGRSNEIAGQTGEGLSNYNSGGAGGPMRVGFAATSATNRKAAGAGYYGNMDMSDNVLERVVTLGRSTGRSFTGTHGDGTVNTTASYEGNATNNDWPGIDGTTNKGVTGASGTGFKGGGYTSSAQYMYTADRTSASVTDSGRDAAYGGRLVRTSP